VLCTGDAGHGGFLGVSRDLGEFWRFVGGRREIDHGVYQ